MNVVYDGLVWRVVRVRPSDNSLTLDRGIQQAVINPLALGEHTLELDAATLRYLETRYHIVFEDPFIKDPVVTTEL